MSEYSYSVLDGRGTCANQNKETKCGRDAVPGHIYCNSCRLQTGGYNAYNPPRFNTFTRTDRSN